MRRFTCYTFATWFGVTAAAQALQGAFIFALVLLVCTVLTTSLAGE